MRIVSITAMCLFGCTALLHACGRSDPSLGQISTVGGSASPSSWAGGITLGTPHDAARGDGSEPAHFRPGETIQLQIDVSMAPANAQVRVTWLDAAGRTAGDESRETRYGGESVMTFDAPVSLAPGNYRVQVRMDGQRIREQAFEVSAA